MKRPSTRERRMEHKTERFASNLRVLSVLLLAFALASCDAVNPTDGIVLQEKTVSFRFQTSMEGVEPGQSIQINADDPADLGPALEADGFTKAEVLSATVTRVELERIQPTTADLSMLDEALLAFTASGVSTRTIASSSSLPSSPETNLSVSSNPDATTFVTAPSFDSSVTIVFETVPQGNLVLRATVTFRIEVEGV